MAVSIISAGVIAGVVIGGTDGGLLIGAGGCLGSNLALLANYRNGDGE